MTFFLLSGTLLDNAVYVVGLLSFFGARFL